MPVKVRCLVVTHTSFALGAAVRVLNAPSIPHRDTRRVPDYLLRPRRRPQDLSPFLLRVESSSIVPMQGAHALRNAGRDN
jgi:hypothetical protein